MKTFASLTAAVSLLAVANMASAAPFPDPQANAPQEIAASKIIGEYPVGTFLENAVIDDGKLIVTDYVRQTLSAIDRETGVQDVIATFPKNVGGVALRDGGYIVTALSQTTTPGIYSVDRHGDFEEIISLPAGTFPNGLTHFNGSQYLFSDSAGSGIWIIDIAARTAKVWIADPSLTPSAPATPFLPGANGLQRHDDFVYVSSMQRELLLRIPVNADGSAGEIEIVAKNVFLDDFAVAQNGDIYATTHVFDSVLKITPEGKVTTIATHDQGLLGPTSAAFGPEGNGNQVLYVTNNGQLYVQPKEGPGTARLVRIDLRKGQTPQR